MILNSVWLYISVISTDLLLIYASVRPELVLDFSKKPSILTLKLKSIYLKHNANGIMLDVHAIVIITIHTEIYYWSQEK